MMKQPWLNEDGSLKNDAELRKVSRYWHPDVWEEYLALYEVERQEHVVLPPDEIDKFSSEEAINQLFDEADFSTEECAEAIFSIVGRYENREENFLNAKYGMVLPITDQLNF